MKLSDKLIRYIKHKFILMGRDTAVIGISGGKDSAVVAALLAKALGPENVYGVMLPNGLQSDIKDSELVITSLGINGLISNIGLQYSTCVEKPTKVVCPAAGNKIKFIQTTPEAAINVPPRLRMEKLYDIAQSLGQFGLHACVVGTGNQAETHVGYCTKWGDMACDINPLRYLWVHEVLQVGDELGYFPEIIHKTPDDGLSGMSDEEKLGFSYNDVYNLIDGDASLVIPENAEKIKVMHQAAKHKLDPIPSPTRAELQLA